MSIIWIIAIVIGSLSFLLFLMMILGLSIGDSAPIRHYIYDYQSSLENNLITLFISPWLIPWLIFEMILWSIRKKPLCGPNVEFKEFRHSGYCNRCQIFIYDEPTVIKIQKKHVDIGFDWIAQLIEKRSAYQCKSCGRTFCKECIEKKGILNNSGGRNCFRCNGQFKIVNL